ncbi:MAG: WD40 repeat domain-containing protein [Candidatus Eiseniibacteriota bacterium]
MRQHWLPLLQSDAAIPVIDERAGTLIEGYATLLARNADPIKLVAFAGIPVLACLYVTHLYLESERLRRVDVAERLASAAFSMQIQPPHDRFDFASSRMHSLHLAVLSERLSPNPIASSVLWTAIQGQPEIRHRLVHDGPVRGVALNGAGTLLATSSAAGTLRIWDLSRGEMLSNFGVGHATSNIALNRSGSAVLEVDESGVLQIWDVSTRELQAKFAYDSKDGFVALSANGRHAAFSGRDLVLLDVGEGRIIRAVERCWFSSGEFTSDGRTFVARRRAAHSVHVFTGSQFERDREVQLPEYRRLWVSPQGGYVASYLSTKGGPTELSVTELTSGEATQTLLPPTHASPGPVVAWSNDETTLAAAAGTVLRILDLRTGRAQEAEVESRIRAIDFLDETASLVTADSDGTVMVRQLSDLRESARIYLDAQVAELQALEGPPRILVSNSQFSAHLVTIWDLELRGRTTLRCGLGFRTMRLSPDGSLVVAAAGDTLVGMDRDGRQLWTAPESGVKWITFSRCGTWFLACTEDGQTRVRDARSGRTLSSLVAQREVCACLALDATSYALGLSDGVIEIRDAVTGSLLATARDDTVVEIRDIDEGEAVVSSTTVVSAVRHLAVSANGSRLASGHDTGTVIVWDLPNLRELRRVYPVVGSDLVSLALNPTGSVVAAGVSGTVSLFHVPTGIQYGRIRSGDVDMVCHPSRWRIAVGMGKDNTLNAGIYSLITGRLLVDLRDGGGGPHKLCFDPQGRYIVGVQSAHPATLQLRSAESGRVLAAYEFPSEIEDVEMSRSGRTLAVVASSGDVFVQIWSPEDLIEGACKRLPRNLTLREWKSLVGDEDYERTFEER